MPELMKMCKHCGSEYFVQCKSRLRRSNFCSIKCKNEFNGTLKRDKSSRWAGGRVLTTRPRKKYDGSRYSQQLVLDKEHCESTGRKGRYIAEHVLIAEKVLGRRLKKGECVHHINCDSLDNRNSNLLICTNGYHSYLHQKMSEMYAKENFGAKSS